ncbi:hypothetical protein BJF93_08660 [Xaviernesmea oryzae]|uniref:DUF930 domain-containing protein n=1 Tax=Xaviernesmea oryzae TaxID=464029 RepID=A0A1Q9B116_9HYPH|nr:DUF930 domain-containing protein [Xaviernesmea oryzae]OLP61664.1 hypothetical protein BJF93_08660 [Xaviernesmea oryzae]SEL03735.1 protein of unknown function [Xaviernesmea oryzae]
MKHTSLFILVSLLATGTSAPVFALSNERLNGQLMKLDPETRLEQTCDTEVMDQINRERSRFNVDKVIAYTFKDPVIKANLMEAPGAALRSNGRWYRLSFRCQTGPRHLDAHQLDYTLGAEIPRAEWPAHYLYD